MLACSSLSSPIIDVQDRTVWLFLAFCSGVQVNWLLGQDLVMGIGVNTCDGGLWQVMLAAGDTFRAAACEQLAMWADRTEVEMCPYEVRQRKNAHPYPTMKIY